MAKNLFDFAGEEIKSDRVHSQNSNETEFEKEAFGKDFNKYKNYTESDLEKEISKEIKRQKANGSFNYTQIKQMIDMMKPYFSADEYQRINQTLERNK